MARGLVLSMQPTDVRIIPERVRTDVVALREPNAAPGVAGACRARPSSISSVTAATVAAFDRSALLACELLVCSAAGASSRRASAPARARDEDSCTVLWASSGTGCEDSSQRVEQL